MPLVLALPALPLALAAIGAMLLAFVFRKQIGDFIVAAFRGLPIVGSLIQDAVAQAIAAQERGAALVLNAAVQPLTNALDFLVGNAMAGVAWLTAAATWLGWTLKGILAYTAQQLKALQVVVQANTSNAITALQRIAAQAVTLASLGARVAWLSATAIPAAISQAVAKATTVAQALTTAARAAALAAVNTALATALRAVGNEAAARSAADAAVKAYAAATAALVGAKAAQGLVGLEAQVGAQVGQLGQAIDNIGARIGPLAYPTVALAIEAVTTTIRTLERTCVNPTCNYLGPQLQALELVGDAFMLAAIADMVAAAATDPQGAAQDTLATAGPLVGMVSGLFADLTGQPIRT